MIFLNAERFIQEAIQSVLSQEYSNWELLLVDDGSSDGSTRIALAAAEENPQKVRYLEHAAHQNRGMSASRNLGARHATGEYLAFLDADDVWLPHALNTAVQILEEHPVAGMLYGRSEWWYSWTGRDEDLGRDHKDPVTQKSGKPNFLAFPPELVRLFGNKMSVIPCPCSILVRKRVFDEVGGFEESIRNLVDDQAFYAKVWSRAIVYVTDACWSLYRQHPGSSCATAAREGKLEQARQELLSWMTGYLHSQGLPEEVLLAREGSEGGEIQTGSLEESLKRISELEQGKTWLEEQWVAWKEIAEERERSIQELKAWISQLEAGKAWLEKDRQYWHGVAEERPKGISGLVRRAAGHLLPRIERLDEVDSGDPGRQKESSELAATTDTSVDLQPAPPDGGAWSLKNGPHQPVSRAWGYDRGMPVDRYYIEKFLEQHATDVQGCVLEIGDNSYTLRYGGARVEKSEVLNVTEDNPLTTIVADLNQADHLPANQFDCVILTQTLQLIYDLRSALNTLHRILKPGGVLLATFPGITRTSVSEWPSSWYWCLTSNSAKRLFEEVFQPSNVVVEACGNVLTASAFLYGFAAHELRKEDLEYRDPEYDLVISVRARKDQVAVAEGYDLKLQRKAYAPGRLAEARALILLYHRIAPPASDPWSLCVSPQHFEDHLQAIREWGTPFHLDELFDRLSAGTLPTHAVAVTFDDGYAATLSQAGPLLEQYEVPATMFVPTAALARAREFWWDELERIFLQPGRLPPTLELEIDQHRFHFNLGDAAFYIQEAFEQNLSWRAWHPAPGPRQQLYTQLWELFHLLDAPLIEEVLDDIFEWASLDTDPRPAHRVLTWREVADLKDDVWIKFGSHGMTHSSLASLPVEVQARELRQSKTSIEAVTDRHITSLAYPYGKPQDYSILTIALAREAGYKRALINSPGVVNQKVDPFYLPRFYVEDWEKEDFARRLLQWMEE
jgi:peptidoglycan/xylan/chitin deacetylase (PgdA/CDA1 family)/SAM-dependent methyltransferase